MKSLVSPLLVLLLLTLAPVFAQQSSAQPDNSQKKSAQQNNLPQSEPSQSELPQSNTQQPDAQKEEAPQATVAPQSSAEAPQASAPSTPQPTAPQVKPLPPNAEQQSTENDKVIEEIVARVNNSIITRTELRRNQEQIAFDAKEQKLTQSQVEERQENSLRDLIDQQLLVQKAAELGISADADLVKRLDEIRKQMNVGSIEELQKAAESQGVHWEEFKQNTKNTILTQKVIGSEVGARIQITREEAEKFYNEHKADFTQPERVRLSEILIANDPAAPKGTPVEAAPDLIAAARAKAIELHAQLTSGAKFDELARKESNGPTAEQGGDLGYFKRNDLAKTLEDQTFKLKIGEFTPPIQTRQGFIILKVNDHIESGTPPFERVREQIHEQIYMQRVQPALREYMSKLRDDAYIDVKPGYTDTGASPNQSKLIYSSDSGPKTKQVRGMLGMGKKKTVVVTGNEKIDESHATGASSPSGGTSGLGLAKAEAEAKEKAARDRKTGEEAAVAKAAAEAVEQEKLSHMSNNEKKRYLAQKKKREEKEAKDDAKRKSMEERKQKELAAKQALRQAAEAKAAANKKPAKETKAAKSKKPANPEKKAKEAASAKSSEQDETSQQAESGQPPQKKKIHWF